MPNFSKIVQVGHLVRDPELRYTPSGKAVANATIATNFGPKDNQEVCFIDVTFWDKTAENAAEYLRKGDAVLVEGRLKMDTWEDKNTGAKRTKHLIVASSMTMLGKKGDGAVNGEPIDVSKGANETKAPWVTVGGEQEPPKNDDDIPF